MRVSKQVVCLGCALANIAWAGNARVWAAANERCKVAGSSDARDGFAENQDPWRARQAIAATVAPSCQPFQNTKHAKTGNQHNHPTNPYSTKRTRGALERWRRDSTRRPSTWTMPWRTRSKELWCAHRRGVKYLRHRHMQQHRHNQRQHPVLHRTCQLCGVRMMSRQHCTRQACWARMCRSPWRHLELLARPLWSASFLAVCSNNSRIGCTLWAIRGRVTAQTTHTRRHPCSKHADPRNRCKSWRAYSFS